MKKICDETMICMCVYYGSQVIYVHEPVCLSLFGRNVTNCGSDNLSTVDIDRFSIYVKNLLHF